MRNIIHKRFLIGLALLTGSLLLIVPTALAGGWAVITLDQLPAQVLAEQPVSVSFMVRQHGMRPMGDLTPQITAVHRDTQKSINITAKPEGRVGHYAASLTFPQPGVWAWSIRAFTMDVPMPPLTILDAAPAANDEPTLPGSWPLLLGALGLIGATGTSLLWWRRRTWWTTALVLVTLVISGVGLLGATYTPIKAEVQISSDPVELGQKLFVAKGCITCHRHDAVQEPSNISLEIGPNLSNFPTTAEYLRVWLKDPATLKPATQMPNLELKQTEIEALIAFLLNRPLNSEDGPAKVQNNNSP